MSSLDLDIERPTDTYCEKTFPILRDFLQLDAAVTLESTAKSILDLLPEKDPHSDNVGSFGEMCIELAEQIPYHHPSQLKLAALLEHLGKSTKLGQIYTPWAEGMSSGQRYHRYQRLGESLRDSLNGPDPDCPSNYINFHAFAANLFERRIFCTDPTWAIWAQRGAHEGWLNDEDEDKFHDIYVLAAAQWILWYGQSFFKQVLSPGDVTLDDLQCWSPGPLYDGKRFLSLHRWHFWRDGFKAVACGEQGGEKGLGQECMTVAAKAADMMDSLEKNMTF